jgi:CheY-like chemotaxis protein
VQAGSLRLSESPEVAEEPRLRKLKILVADDNKDAAESMQRILQVEGHEVQVAYDGKTAIEIAHGFRPEIALLDLDMPGIDGYGVAGAFRTSYGRALMLVAITGLGQEADRAKSLEAGFDFHFTKPVQLSELNRLLARAAQD